MYGITVIILFSRRQPPLSIVGMVMDSSTRSPFRKLLKQFCTAATGSIKNIQRIIHFNKQQTASGIALH